MTKYLCKNIAVYIDAKDKQDARLKLYKKLRDLELQVVLGLTVEEASKQ